MKTIESGTCEIEIYSTGLLGSFGHDLRFQLEQFEIRVDAHGHVEGTFWPESLRVEGAIVDGEVDHSELSESNCEEIRANLRRDVLDLDRHETVDFEGAYELIEGGRAFEVSGELTLVGRSEPLTTRVERRDGRCRTDIGLLQSKWGIEPYSAMMGALKVEDRLQIRLDVPDISERWD